MNPRVLTADELKALPRLAIVFVECWDGEYQDALPEILRAAGIRVLDVGSGRDEAWASIPPDRCAAALRAGGAGRIFALTATSRK